MSSSSDQMLGPAFSPARVFPFSCEALLMLMSMNESSMNAFTFTICKSTLMSQLCEAKRNITHGWLKWLVGLLDEQFPGCRKEAVIWLSSPIPKFLLRILKDLLRPSFTSNSTSIRHPPSAWAAHPAFLFLLFWSSTFLHWPAQCFEPPYDKRAASS